MRRAQGLLPLTLIGWWDRLHASANEALVVTAVGRGNRHAEWRGGAAGWCVAAPWALSAALPVRDVSISERRCEPLSRIWVSPSPDCGRAGAGR